MRMANAQAIVDWVQGEAPSRPRAALMAASAGVAVAVLTYRVLRHPEQD
jgi:alpha/beta superfamily hydrolase